MSIDFIRFIIFVGILGGIVFLAFSVPIFRPYIRKMPLVSFLLGISSGFPLTLLVGTMTFWLAKVDVDLATIGFVVALGTPYTIKFLWAPLVDKLPLPFLTKTFGQRRGWLYLIQILLVGAVWGLGSSDPVRNLGIFAVWAVILAFLSATQDIVIDAYRIEILADDEFAHGTATNQFGYRTGNLIAGAGTIYFASTEGLSLGWGLAYGLTSLCVFPAMFASLWAGPGNYVNKFVKAEGVRTTDWLIETVVNPFKEFMGRKGWLMILLFVLVYKVGDAMGQSMLNPMVVKLGFSDLEFISASKAWGFAALIIGSALGAPFILLLGMGRALVISGFMMMFSNVMFMVLAASGQNYWVLVAAIVTENMTSGIGLTVFTTYLSGLSSLAYTATQFALLSSLAAVARTWLSTPAGYLAKQLGWMGFWGFTIVAAVPGMILLWILWSKGYVVESVRQSKVTTQERNATAS
jgi:MFS transporter, PAT family, beta-lactamase induction signal transducer AmpG